MRQSNPKQPKLSTALLPIKAQPTDVISINQIKQTSLFLSPPLFFHPHPSSLTSGGWGSIGSDFERSPAIMLVDEDEAMRALTGSDGATNAVAPAAKAKVAAISNFMVDTV